MRFCGICEKKTSNKEFCNDCTRQMFNQRKVIKNKLQQKKLTKEKPTDGNQ